MEERRANATIVFHHPCSGFDGKNCPEGRFFPTHKYTQLQKLRYYNSVPTMISAVFINYNFLFFPKLNFTFSTTCILLFPLGNSFLEVRFAAGFDLEGL